MPSWLLYDADLTLLPVSVRVSEPFDEPCEAALPGTPRLPKAPGIGGVMEDWEEADDLPDVGIYPKPALSGPR